MGARPKLQILKLFATIVVAFFIFSVGTGHTSRVSAISIGSVSGTDSAPVSVSVSNSPLAYYISVSSSHGSSSSPVNLSYTMDGSGNQLGNVVSSSDLVTIDTNSPMSHQLLLSTTSDNTTTKANNLVGDNTQEDTETGGLVPNTYIAPTSSTSLSTASSLSSNTWGFALNNGTPGIVPNNFDSDYSTVTNDSKFTSVPAKNSEILVLEDTTATSTTTIYYGVLADRSLPAGDYSNTILYTALAEQPSEIRVIPNTIDLSDPYQTLTIYTSINTTSEVVSSETATVKFYQEVDDSLVEKGTCTSPTVNVDGDNYLNVTCTSPVLYPGKYNLELTLENLGKVLVDTDAVAFLRPDFTLDPELTISPIQVNAGGSNDLNITTGVTGITTETLWTIGVTVDDETCASPTGTIENGTLSVTCVTPAFAPVKTGELEVTLTLVDWNSATSNGKVVASIPTVTNCSQLNINQIGTHRGYQIRKMADNKCWQTSNYTSNTLWTNISCPAGYTLPSKDMFNTLLNSVGRTGELYKLGGWSGDYWSSTADGSGNAFYLYSGDSYATVYSTVTGHRFQVRCYTTN